MIGEKTEEFGSLAEKLRGALEPRENVVAIVSMQPFVPHR
jgi:hypothetical protein